MTLPDFLPTLSAGSHDPSDGQACLMEYVSLLAGEEWSDRPECTHEILAHEARTTNDLLRDGDRPRLVPLIGRLFGTSQDSPDIRARLRIEQARHVLELLEPESRGPVLAAIARAESWIGRESDEHDVADAYAASSGFSLPQGDLDPDHVDHHAAAARLFMFAHWTQIEAAEAHAMAAVSLAHIVAASGECRADCGNGPARARRMARNLGRLVDVYDDVTGRVARDVPAEQIRELAASLR
jgi:hypothetical protein